MRCTCGRKGQAPFWQLSPVVQALPSLHGLPAVTLGFWHVYTPPVPCTQLSLVQALLSLQAVAAVSGVQVQTLPEPTQLPDTHLSVEVQALLSLQFAALLV